MAKTLREKMKTLGAERQKKIETRAAQLIAEEKTLRDLRQAHHLTQESMAEFLGVGQEAVSRLEKRTDLLISTLRRFIGAMGGDLQLVAKFPDRPPVILSGLAEMGMEANRRNKTENSQVSEAE